jgi:hypothetical protein
MRLRIVHALKQCAIEVAASAGIKQTGDAAHES